MSTKTSTVSWIGEFPSTWELKKVKHVMRQIGSGGTPETSNEAFWDGDIPWIAIGDMSNREFVTSTAKRLTQAGLASKRLKVWPRGTLLFSMYASLGHVAETAMPAATNQAILALVPDASANQAYLKRWFQFIRPYLIEDARSNTQDNLNAEKVRNLPVLLPPLQIQQQIVSYLDREISKYARLRSAQERLIGVLKEKRQRAIIDLVTGAESKGVVRSPSGLGWVGQLPSHWKVQPLKSVATFRSGGTPDKSRPEFWDGGIPWASAKDLKVDLVHDTEDHITQVAILSRAAALVPAGSILVVVRGMILARTFPVCISSVEMAINQDLKALLPRNEMHGRYLAWVLRASEDETMNRLDEAGHGTKALRMDAWASMKIPVPPLDEQIAICDEIELRVERIDQLVAAVSKALELSEEREYELIADCVTGRVMSDPRVHASDKEETVLELE